MTNCHCIQCGKEYKYWGCINNHFKKEHPESKCFYRTIEIMDSLAKEAQMFIDGDYHKIPWMQEDGDK